ncbi:host-nuclease inhibitor Gam family protein [Cohnella nanjingensis]|uniref:Host-nuclease inhibitor Gam family protein n=1 Tax=Cohnella nanjingensis TaxID=1387779 RepID=A0A7X0VH09_9BACL|nr:host-nuclease inhibitor Gam family protein [Cohnella nanjingensis]MBB6672998.1 host-nuclease inhibitor Gam family protein [Cohnella nanjingensis]
MAKTKEQPVFQSWDEVNEGMRSLIEIDQHVTNIESTMNNQLNEIKKDAELRAKPLLAQKEKLMKDIQAFTEHHIDEFRESKTKSLTFGEVGFRRATSISYRNVKAVLEALKLHKMTDCIKVTEAIEKDQLSKYDDAALARIGVKRTSKDKFFLKPAVERIEVQ